MSELPSDEIRSRLEAKVKAGLELDDNMAKKIKNEEIMAFVDAFNRGA